MDKETIQSKALEFASLRYGNSGNETGNEIAKVQACAVGFKQGAKWRINSVWHDKNEVPKAGKIVLFFTSDKCFERWNGTYWKDVVAYYDVKKWAYIEDLLPDRKEAEK